MEAPIFEVKRIEWPDLADDGKGARHARKWGRARSWGSDKIYGRFQRSDAFAVSCDLGAHETLKKCLAGAASAWEIIYDALGRRIGEFKPTSGAKGVVSVPSRLKLEFTNKLRHSMGESEAKTVWGFAKLQAAMRAFDEGKMEAIWARAPELPFKSGDRMPCGLTVKLPAGLAYDAPINSVGCKVDLGLEGIGRLNLERGWPQKIDTAAYVEVATWDKTWWIRFIWADDVKKV